MFNLPNRMDDDDEIKIPVLFAVVYVIGVRPLGDSAV